MSDQARSGVLRWDPDRRALFVDGDAKPKRVTRPDRDLTGDLAGQDLPDLDGLAVDFEWRGGQPRDIRLSGIPAPARKPRPANPDAFYNPYTFVPATPRERLHPALDDAATAGLAGHGRLRPDLWTGRIAVTLAVRTPLLLLDASRRTPTGGSGHYTYPVLTRDGVPHLPPTSVKGMLRTAYEAVTNSRFGVLDSHLDRLGYRMQASTARSMVPAQVNVDGTKLLLLPGDTKPGLQGLPNAILHAAWLPAYGGGWDKVDHPAGWSPGHGGAVEAWVELFQHYRRRSGELTKDFRLWRVRATWPSGQTARPEPDATPEPNPGASYVPVTGAKLKRIAGHVFHTNQNIDRKHDERIFFTDGQPAETRDLTVPLRDQWEEMIRSYRAAHAPREIHRTDHGQVVPPSKYLGREPGKTAWSPHQYDDSYLTLRPGMFCYAMVDGAGKVVGVYPVMVARSLHEAAPRSLLPDRLLPAGTLDELSAADRVFGWVKGDGQGSYRGQLRIGPVSCEQGADAVSSDAADFGEDGVPLAILGKPRPQQGRFYLAAHRAAPGRPLADGTLKSKWFQPIHGLRGRKFYWHHAGLADSHWHQPIEDRTQQVDETGRFQEYRRPREGSADGRLTADTRAFLIADNAPEQRDDQNRSVRGWVKPGSTFRFTIEVTNLSTVELGALAWLLMLPPEHYHRFGYGKPLGFGSVRLDVEPSSTDLRQGSDWTDRYRSLRPAGNPADATAITTILDSAAAAFAAAATADGEALSAALTAFLAVTRGDTSAAIHYPRVRPSAMDEPSAPALPVPPDPRGRSFEWFSLNEKEEGNKIADGRGLSLPSPTGDPLPIYTSDKRGGNRA